MSGYVLEVKSVCKSYGKKTVLRDAHLRLKRGDICGLVGPNGSGKTTLLRLVTGLAQPGSGSVHLFGQEGHRPEAMRRMGCLVEQPRIHPGLTARENLQMQQTLLGIPEDKVGATLDLVGLSSTEKKRAGKFSKGMKQRLGIGMALIGSPDLLCLDEPVSNLDPQGVYDVRSMLQRLNQESGVTVLMSSHMLGEVEKLATCYAILRDGSIRSVTEEEMRERGRHYALIVTDNPRAAAVVLDRIGAGEYEVMPDGSFKLYDVLDRMSQINAALVESGVGVLEIHQKTASLEDLFLAEQGGKEDA